MKCKWNTVPLRDLIGFISKGIAPSYVENETEVTIRVLNQKCNKNFQISYEQSRLHDTSKKKVSTERYIQENDILINSTGTGTAGRIAQINGVPCKTTVDSHMMIVRANQKVTQRYLGYALKAHQWEVLQLDEGSTGQTELNRVRLLDEILISYPESLEEQEKIVALLSGIDEKIELNNKINENLEQQVQAIFKAWFVEYLPFECAKPNNWKVYTLGEITQMSAGGDKPKSISSTKSTKYPYPIYSNGLDREGLYGYTNEAKIFAESVTVSARGTIGFVCLRHIPYVPIVRLVTLIPNENLISAKYLYLYLKQLHITGTGTTQQQLTVPGFRKTEILVPDKSIIDRFTDLISPMFNKIWENEEENIKLSSLRDSLLPKLMSGKIAISNL